MKDDQLMIARSIALFLICGLALAEDVAMVSSAEVIKVLQFETLRPMFEYCQAAVPEIEMEVASEFASFIGTCEGNSSILRGPR